MHHASALCINMHTMYKKIAQSDVCQARTNAMQCYSKNCDPMRVQQSAVVERFLSKEMAKGLLVFVFVFVFIIVFLIVFP